MTSSPCFMRGMEQKSVTGDQWLNHAHARGTEPSRVEVDGRGDGFAGQEACEQTVCNSTCQVVY